MDRRLTAVAVAVPAVVVALLTPTGPASGATAAPAGIAGVTRTITAASSTPFTPTKAGTVGRPANNELSPVQLSEGDVAGGAGARAAATSGKRYTARVNSSLAARGTRAAERPTAGIAAAGSTAATAVTAPGRELVRSLRGLNHFDSRTADGGNQFSNEPPDQGLCAGGGKVVESVNTAVQVYDTDGTAHGVTSLNKFYGLPSAFVRPAGPFGPNLFDPTCVYDPQTKTFFHVVDDLAVDPATGDLTGQAFLDIAVAKDPLGTWTVYRLDVTNDGSNGTPTHTDCPCFGDYPHVGLDRNGFYITTNEFPLAVDGFNGAQVYAFSKAELAAGAASVHVTAFDTTGADQGLGGFTVWPAQSPSTGDFSRQAGGTEYFLSSNAVFGATEADIHSTSIVVWSLTDTGTLGQDVPSARLHDARVAVPEYSLPDPVRQKPGPTPLRSCLNRPDCRGNFADPGPKEKLQTLDSNDTRMQQVAFVDGKLYGALDTNVTVKGERHAGIAWYVLEPSTTRAAVSAEVHVTGKLAVAGGDVTYPAVAVTSSGRGVMAFTLAGPNRYPSAAYATIGEKGVGPVRVAAAGVGPQDGFAGYDVFNGGPGTARPRWGDYGGAAAVGGDVWIASEYIAQRCSLTTYLSDPFGTCNNTRTALANWATRVSLVRP